MDLDKIQRRTGNSPDLEQLGLPVCAGRLLRDAHRHTWYTIGASEVVHQTERGSRPGSPMADIAFNSLMALVLVLDELQQRSDARSSLQCAFAHLGVQALPVAWVDDLALPLAAFRGGKFGAGNSMDADDGHRGVCVLWVPIQPEAKENGSCSSLSRRRCP